MLSKDTKVEIVEVSTTGWYKIKFSPAVVIPVFITVGGFCSDDTSFLPTSTYLFDTKVDCPGRTFCR